MAVRGFVVLYNFWGDFLRAALLLLWNPTILISDKLLSGNLLQNVAFVIYSRQGGITPSAAIRAMRNRRNDHETNPFAAAAHGLPAARRLPDRARVLLLRVGEAVYGPVSGNAFTGIYERNQLRLGQRLDERRHKHNIRPL